LIRLIEMLVGAQPGEDSANSARESRAGSSR
jgi:hypothetical protein